MNSRLVGYRILGSFFSIPNAIVFALQIYIMDKLKTGFFHADQVFYADILLCSSALYLPIVCILKKLLSSVSLY